MPRAARHFLSIDLIGVLAACHTDPFSMKPEVQGITLAKGPPAEPESETPAPEPLT